jgi:hypothetical protein
MQPTNPDCDIASDVVYGAVYGSFSAGSLYMLTDFTFLRYVRHRRTFRLLLYLISGSLFHSLLQNQDVRGIRT